MVPSGGRIGALIIRNARMAGKSTFSQEKADKICSYIVKGLPVEMAAQFVGVTSKTVTNWRAANPAFDIQYNAALEGVIMPLLTCLMEAGKSDQEYSLKFLMRRFPKFFGTFDKFQDAWNATNDPVSAEQRMDAEELTKALERDDRMKKE